MANIFAVELIPFSLEFQIIGWFKVVPKAKFIQLCFKYLQTDYVEGLELSTCDIYDSIHNLRKNLLFCSVPRNLWNFMKLRDVFKRPSCRKTSLNSKLLLILLKMVWLIHKDEGNKEFQQSLLHRHSRNDAFLMFTLFPCKSQKWFGVDWRK